MTELEELEDFAFPSGDPGRSVSGVWRGSKATRNAALVSYYKSGNSISQCAARFSISFARVQQLLYRHCPESIRPAKGQANAQ